MLYHQKVQCLLNTEYTSYNNVENKLFTLLSKVLMKRKHYKLTHFKLNSRILASRVCTSYVCLEVISHVEL